MSLEQALKDMKEELEEAKKIEDAVEEDVEESEEEKPEEEKEEEKEEAPKEEEKKEEPKEEEKLDNSAYARMRREAAAAKKRAEELEAENARLKAAPKEDAEPVEEAHVPEEVKEVLQEVRMQKAEREFQNLEQEFKRDNPGYDDVAAEYSMALARAIKIQNPRMSNDAVAEQTKRTILLKAAQYLQDGFNPIEELYHEAQELGFTGESRKQKEVPEAKETKEEKEVKPDMKKVAANRAKSSGMTASNGRSEGQMTKLAASELSVAEWAKLPQEEKRRLMYG